MGSSSKKHKKDREGTSRKHKHRSRSRSEDYSVDRENHSSSRHRHRSRSPALTSGRSVYESGRDRDRERDRETRERRHKHHHHKRHKDRKNKHRSKDREREDNQTVVIDDDDSDSDSSDVIEVPLAPPAPIISKPATEPEIQKEIEPERPREREPERPRERETERPREREPERPREREQDRQREREQDRQREREQDRQREREQDRQREREQDRQREREQDRQREREQDRQREREQDRQRERDSEKFRHREVDRNRERESERIRARSPSPFPENGAGDCLSIEETNKLRAKLGLKPLEVESSQPVARETRANKNDEGLKSFKDEWGEFLHKPAANLQEKQEAEKLREKLKERKEKRTLEDRLKKVRALGDSDEEVDDVKKWVEKSKKREEEIRAAERRAKLLEEMDAEFGVGSIVNEEARRAKDNAYKYRDLKGLRVEHDIDEFTEGRQVILTLKDRDVLDEGEDALVNVNLVDEERYRKNVENRKLKPNAYGYDVYEEAVDEFGNPIDRSILNKYDEEIGGSAKKSFTIGENLEEERVHKRKLLEIRTKLAGKRLETLDDLALKLASDTFTENEMATFKKPKKKVKKLRQKLRADDLLPLAGQTSQNDLGRRNRNGVSSLDTDDVPDIPVDDSGVKIEDDTEDDLEKVLSKARKLKQKESIIQKPVQIDASEIKAEIKTEAESDDEMADTKDGNIILNATAEFCRTLGDIPTYGMAGNREEASNELMDFELETMEPEVPSELKIEPSTGTWNSVNPDTAPRVSSDDIVSDVAEVAILDEEPDVGEGVAAALRLAMSKGYLEKEDKNRPSNSRMAHLQAKNYSIEDKTYVEDDKFGRRDRYHSGPIMDFREKDTFKPNVKLEYIDDNGRVLNAKEAFRYLSHKFHGKGPGKNKIEKRLKKMEQDGLMMKMSSTDTPLGTLSMLQQKQKETHTAYVVLSGSKQNHASTSISKHK